MIDQGPIGPGCATAWGMAEKRRGIEKTREGVPIWDGDSSTFQEYEECALMWEQSIALHKRCLCGPRLATELCGTAKKFVIGKRADWLSHGGGVSKLLTHLRQNLGLPQLPEMTELLTRFFKQGRRRRGETMNEYITRKMEVYARARQSMARLMKHYHFGLEPGSSRGGSWTSWNGWRSNASVSAPMTSQEHHRQDDDAEAPPGFEHTDEAFHEEEQPPEEQGSCHSWYSTQSDWRWYGRQWHDDRWCSSWEPPHSEEADWTQEAPELLPDMIQGWYLLADAGLSPSERNVVLAALKGDYSLQRVAQELRNQWWASGWVASDDAALETIDEESADALTLDDLTGEEQAMMMEAEDQAQHAMAMIENGRKTLREARARQNQVRLSRRYFKPAFKKPTPGGQPRGSTLGGGIACLRCGGPHRVAECPQPSKPSAAVATEEAPSACYADDLEVKNVLVLSDEEATDTNQVLAEPAMTEYDQVLVNDLVESGFIGGQVGRPLTTQEAVAQGKAVLDGGATKTLGSVRAIEKVMQLNQEFNGTTCLKALDLQDRPTFGFGNSSKNTCVSTAQIGIQADGKEGSIRVHALDQGDGPILFSIASLRALGAIVDFSEDLIVFRKLTDRKVIQLERSVTGHQLIPMTSDWYAQAQETARPVPSLRDFI